MSPPLPPLRKLAGAVELDGEHRLRLMAPLGLYLWEGALAVVAAPVVGLSFGVLITLQFPEERHAGMAGLVACVAAGGLMLMGGLGKLATAGRRRRRSGCTLDLQAGTLSRAGERPRQLSALRRLRVAKPSAWLNPVAIIASGAEGDVVLLRGVPPRAQAELAAIAAYLGARLDLPVDVPAWAARASLFGLSDRQAALLCWFPFQGVFLFASAWYLLFGKDRPFVRHAARMSLLHFAAGIAALVVLGGIGALGWALLDALGVEGPAAAAPLMFTLLVNWLWNFGSRVYGCVRALSGVSWVPLWVRPFAGAAPPPPADHSG